MASDASLTTLAGPVLRDSETVLTADDLRALLRALERWPAACLLRPETVRSKSS